VNTITEHTDSRAISFGSDRSEEETRREIQNIPATTKARATTEVGVSYQFHPIIEPMIAARIRMTPSHLHAVRVNSRAESTGSRRFAHKTAARKAKPGTDGKRYVAVYCRAGIKSSGQQTAHRIA
jgi:hypothetical protein